MPFRYPPAGGFVGVDSSDAGEVVVRGAGGEGVSASKRSAGPTGPVVIVLTPSRDLAEQTHKAFTDLSRHVVGPAITASLVIGTVV